MSAYTIANTFITTDGAIEAPTAEVDRALQNMDTKPRKTRKSRSKKDENAPKRPLSGYMLWLGDNRNAIAEEYCNELTGKERMNATLKKAGALWKELTDDEKKPYEDKNLILKAEYAEAMKEYVPTKPSKKSSHKYDVEEMPAAPEGWTGAFELKYLLKKVSDVDGKSVRIIKSFQDAVAKGLEINAAWQAAKNTGDLPGHWDKNMQPCGGITKTSTGYDLRVGPDLISTPASKAKAGLASWVIGEYTAPVPSNTAMENSNIYDAETDTEENTITYTENTHAENTQNEKPKAQAQDTQDEKAKAQAEKPTAEAEKPKAKAKAKAKKLTTKTKPKNKYTLDELELIEIEKDGADVELYLHEDSGEVFTKDNLVEACGKVDNGEIEFF